MITTQELVEWLHSESRLCNHIADQPYIATDAEKEQWWLSKAEYLRESSERLSIFEDIIREMTTEQRATFDTVVAKAENDKE